MLFNSFDFLIFFPVVILLYYLLPYRMRWMLLLISSYYFYMAWKPVYILIILFSTFVDYFASIRMGQTKDKKKRKKYLALSLITNLGVLFFFKYLLFFNQSISTVFNLFNWQYPIPTNFSILLPMGISFYTFQTMSYTIDVYKGVIKPEKHFGIFALYVSYFPQLVAGPIERSERLLPQFYEKHKWNGSQILLGLKLMLVGFFKKIVIADRVAIAVNTIYNEPYAYNGLYFVIATVLFAFQIYCDFSGYSEIAIGAAKVMGVDLMANFRSPYFATSIKDFWKRWHISLSSWFRDYVYIPLGGSRVSIARTYINILIVFLVSGLWHGANWTFVIWGGLHGFYQLFGHITGPVRAKIISSTHMNRLPWLVNFVQRVITFLLVCFAWIFFRANGITDARYIVGNLFANWIEWFDLGYFYDVVTTMGLNSAELIIIALAILLLYLIERFSQKKNIHERLLHAPLLFRWSFYYVLLIFVVTMGVFYHASEFIYFQF